MNVIMRRTIAGVAVSALALGGTLLATGASAASAARPATRIATSVHGNSTHTRHTDHGGKNDIVILADDPNQVIDQSLPQYDASDIGTRKPMTDAEFDAAWSQGEKLLQATLQAKAKGTISPAADASASYEYDISQPGTTTTKTSIIATPACSDPYNTGTTQFSAAWDELLVTVSSGAHHYYVQPHKGTGWLVARTYTGHTRYIHEMAYFGDANGLYYGKQDSELQDNNVPTGAGGLIFNNAWDVTNIHQGNLGTHSTWWHDLGGAALSWFRAEVPITDNPYLEMLYNYQGPLYDNRTSLAGIDQQMVGNYVSDCATS